jgi:hypothetical protein
MMRRAILILHHFIHVYIKFRCAFRLTTSSHRLRQLKANLALLSLSHLRTHNSLNNDVFLTWPPR